MSASKQSLEPEQDFYHFDKDNRETTEVFKCTGLASDGAKGFKSFPNVI